MTARQLRLLRAAAASSVSTLVAAVSHTVGGGAAPSALLVVAVAVLLTPLSALLVGARPARSRVAATVLAAQAVFHGVFQLLGAPTGGAIVGGHVHRLDLSGPLSAATSPDAGMLGAHVLAALLTTAVLWHGERMLRAVAGWVRAVLRRAVPLAPSVHERPAPLRSSLRTAADAVLSSVVSRRGPPAFSRG